MNNPFPYRRDCTKCGTSALFKDLRAKLCKSCQHDNGTRFLKKAYSGNFLRIRNLIFERDRYMCQCCQKTNEQSILINHRSLAVHHINGNTKNNTLDNLITLCGECHKSLHNKYGNKFTRTRNIREMFPKEIIKGLYGNRLVYKPN